MTSGLNDQLMAMASVRYCLGRSSYIVGACVEWVRDNWEQCEANTKDVIVRDVREAIQRGELGMECDARDWRALDDWMHEHGRPRP